MTVDWRVTTMEQIRKLIKQADPEVVEEQKYKKPTNPAGIPVWYHNGMICTGETYKEHLRIGFVKGAQLKANDPKGLFNAYRAMIIKEGDKINGPAFKAIFKAAVKLNAQGKKK